jgi:hypothetical protein
MHQLVDAAGQLGRNKWRETAFGQAKLTLSSHLAFNNCLRFKVNGMEVRGL